MRTISPERYHPLYFLASLGAGGLAVTFFLYFMFLLPHPGTPMPTFSDVVGAWIGADWPVRMLISLGLAAVLALALMHYRLIVWNLLRYRAYRRSDAFQKLRRANGEVVLMSIPLTLAMAINVAFVVGSLFVPGLWDYAEYLFPAALLGYLAVGIYALRIYGRYLGHLVTTGTFDFIGNAGLGQLVPVFAFAMISVGFAAPGAMSHQPEINAIGIFMSLFFMSLALLLGIVKLVVGTASMLRHGLETTASPSLWIVIPILTLFGITAIRLTMGLHHGFDAPVSNPGLFVLTSTILSLQILFGLGGYLVMKRLGYFRDYVDGERSHPGAYALICPGVAFFVFGMFWIVFGLVKNGLIEHYEPLFFLFMAPLVWVQIKSLTTLLRLNGKLLHAPRHAA